MLKAKMSVRPFNQAKNLRKIEVYTEIGSPTQLIVKDCDDNTITELDIKQGVNKALSEVLGIPENGNNIIPTNLLDFCKHFLALAYLGDELASAYENDHLVPESLQVSYDFERRWFVEFMELYPNDSYFLQQILVRQLNQTEK